MALEHMVWLTPKADVRADKMEEILTSILALTHIPGVIAISAGRNIRIAPVVRRMGYW
jgi:hypothetical protein